jgi:hypothetical protein
MQFITPSRAIGVGHQPSQDLPKPSRPLPLWLLIAALSGDTIYCANAG